MKRVVKQDYQIVNARYKLTTTEIKFILITIAQIEEDDEDLREYVIEKKELESLLDTKQNETRLKQFAKTLMSKPIEIKKERGFAIYNWFSKIEYDGKKSCFFVNIHPDLKPYFLNLKQRFVIYNLKYVLSLRSSYSVRIYQLLKEYEKIKKRKMSIDELRELLKIPKSYLYGDIKKEILEKVKKDINENCDITFAYEEIKKNRKVVEISFFIEPKENKRTKKDGLIQEKKHEMIEEAKRCYSKTGGNCSFRRYGKSFSTSGTCDYCLKFYG